MDLKEVTKSACACPFAGHVHATVVISSRHDISLSVAQVVRTLPQVSRFAFNQFPVKDLKR